MGHMITSPGAVRAWARFAKPSFDPMVAIAGKFYEDVKVQDPNGAENAARYQEKDDLYYIKTHTEAYSPLFRPDFLIFGQGLISRELLMAVGGFWRKSVLPLGAAVVAAPPWSLNSKAVVRPTRPMDTGVPPETVL